MNKIKEILTDSIKQLIIHSTSETKINLLKNKHDVKIHFIPYKYRVFGGILQSMNIQFGNFIEKVIEEVILDNENNEIISKYSGIKSNSFTLTKKSDALIDTYITNCQINNYTEVQLKEAFTNLINQIKVNEADNANEIATFKHDVDILFRNKIDNQYYYLEIKYNDDHDTGKYVDINRKLLKTYAYLQRELGQNIKLKPILFYFTNKKMKGNIYLPESEAIYRGKRFFDNFTNIKYEDMDNYMKTISESSETIEAFDKLYNKIVK